MPRSLLSSLNGSELRAQWIIRLKKVLAEVVSTSQNAFVEGKRILYAALVANKVMDSKIKQGVPGVLCKLDLEKAYDHVLVFCFGIEYKLLPSQKNSRIPLCFKCDLGRSEGNESTFVFLCRTTGNKDRNGLSAELKWKYVMNDDSLDRLCKLDNDGSVTVVRLQRWFKIHLKASFKVVMWLSLLEVIWKCDVNLVDESSFVMDELLQSIFGDGEISHEPTLWSTLKMEEMIPWIMSVTGNVEFARCLLDGNSYPTGKILLCTVHKIEFQYDKTSKQVDVQVLKETLGDQLNQTSVKGLSETTSLPPRGGGKEEDLDYKCFEFILLLEDPKKLKSDKWERVIHPKFPDITNGSSLVKKVVNAKHGTNNHWSTKVVSSPFGVGPWKYISKLGVKFYLNWDKAIGKYFVKAAYNSLCAQNEMLVNWPCKSIWKTKLSPKALETNRHLLHCPVATGIWNMFISVFGLKWVMPRSFKDALKETIDALKAPLLQATFLSLDSRALTTFCSWSNFPPRNSPETFLDFVSSSTLDISLCNRANNNNIMLDGFLPSVNEKFSLRQKDWAASLFWHGWSCVENVHHEVWVWDFHVGVPKFEILTKSRGLSRPMLKSGVNHGNGIGIVPPGYYGGSCKALTKQVLENHITKNFMY
ncbi:hypothetical protein H5410_000444 [Solanum commersonii]|uniref:Reverse transcriptase domain-containing protein n=1 Tax=Solanum commersonii TaxID=4109 RepID=A0A9J6AX83_SOLCO|nr:hypothetical protein H5410_000444 [Solanum commersonii]